MRWRMRFRAGDAANWCRPKFQTREKHRQKISSFNANIAALQINDAQSRRDHYPSPRIKFSIHPCALVAVPQIHKYCRTLARPNLTPVVFPEDHAFSAKRPALTGRPRLRLGFLFV